MLRIFRDPRLIGEMQRRFRESWPASRDGSSAELVVMPDETEPAGFQLHAEKYTFRLASRQYIRRYVPSAILEQPSHQAALFAIVEKLASDLKRMYP